MKKITLFLMSLFLTVGAMAQEPFLTFDNPNLSNGPVELTSEQVQLITGKDAITVIVEADVTNSSDASIVLGVIKDYNGTMNTNHDILALGIGGGQSRFYIGNANGQYYSRGTVGTGKKCLAYTLDVNGNDNIFINRTLLEPDRLFTIPKTFKDFTGENAKFYIGGIKSSTATWGTFNGTIYSVKIYEGSLSEDAISAIFENEKNEAKNEAKSFVDSFEGKVGYPNESAVETYISAIDNSIIAKDFETVKNTLYNSTDINLPVDGGTYTFTFVDLDGEKYYINCTGSALSLVKLEEGATIPYTAWFRTDLNEDNTTYSVRTYNNKYIRYTNSNNGIADSESDYTKISFDKMLKSGDYVKVENDKLFGLMRIRSKRGNDTGTFVAKKEKNNDGTYTYSFDGSAGYHFENRNATTSFTTAVSIERVDVPTSGKYYRFKGYNNSNAYMMSNGVSNRMTVNVNPDIAASIFYINENNQPVNYKYGVGVKDTYDSGSITSTKETFTFIPNDNGYVIQTNTRTVNNNSNGEYVYHHLIEGNAQTANVNRNSSTAGERTTWIVETVTSLPVTITDAKYATFFAPVAVEVPEGVTAHTVTINGDRVKLTKIDSGVIPANTGVVLYADVEEDTTYNFDITENVEGIASDLRGSVAATYYTTAGTYYALGLVDGEVGFYKDAFNNSRFQNNSHKAYLYVENTNPAALSTSLRFDFAGTTAIEEVETENAEVVIYDLAGRRVNEITKAGIYVVNGKKVLVK